VEAGRRIETSVQETIGEAAGVSTVVVSSLANDHCDYLTTAEEYEEQCYEGASTLFGPLQQRFVAACTAQLAADVVKDGWVPDQLPARRFDFTVQRYLARPDGVEVTRTPQPARFVEATVTEDAYWEMVWRDVAPGALTWHEPLVRVEAETADGRWFPQSATTGRSTTKGGTSASPTSARTRRVAIATPPAGTTRTSAEADGTASCWWPTPGAPRPAAKRSTRRHDPSPLTSTCAVRPADRVHDGQGRAARLTHTSAAT
jgi:hypothetical protein